MLREWLRFVGANAAGALANFTIYVVLINFVSGFFGNY